VKREEPCYVRASSVLADDADYPADHCAGNRFHGQQYQSRVVNQHHVPRRRSCRSSITPT
jgi:hypothetical protein